MEWQILPLAGKDFARYNHAAITIDDEFFIFGGAAQEKQEAFFNDLIKVVVQGEKIAAAPVKCTSRTGKQFPMHRKGHSFVAVPNKQISQNETEIIDEKQKYQDSKQSKQQATTSFMMQRLQEDNDNDSDDEKLVAAKNKQQQQEFQPRVCAILFAGYDSEKYLNDVWLLHKMASDKFEWEQVQFESTDKQPEPRTQHSCSIVELNNQFYMYMMFGFNGHKALGDTVWKKQLILIT